MAPASEIKCRMAERAQSAWRSIRLGLPSLQRIRNLGGTKSPITARRSRDSQRPHTSRTFLKREPQDQTNKTFTWEFISSTARCIVRCKGVGFIRVKIEILRIHPDSGSPPAQHRQWNRNTCECLQKSALFQIPSSSHESNDPERRRPTYGSWPNDYVLDRVRGKRKCPFLSEGCPATMRIPESGHFLILIDSKISQCDF